MSKLSEFRAELNKDLPKAAVLLGIKLCVIASVLEYLLYGNVFPRYLSYIFVICLVSYQIGFNNAKKDEKK